MEPVARDLLGEPSQHFNSRNELRFGSRGSLSVRLDKGTWFDHETQEGGGVLDLVKRHKRLDNDAAMSWLEVHGYIAKETRNSRAADKPNRRIISTYNYTDADEKLLYQVVRYDPKDFRQRAPDGSGGWIWKMDGIQRVLYRLPEVIQAISEHQTIFICEGEKGVHSLESIGAIATCSPGGAGKWRPVYNASLSGANVVILPDNDPPAALPNGMPKLHPDGRPVIAGQDHARDIAENLIGVAASVRILMLPGLPLKGDVADWIADGGTFEMLDDLASECIPLERPSANGRAHTINGHAAPIWDDPPPESESAYGTTAKRPDSAPEEVPPEFADDTLALNFSDRYGAELRYVAAWSRWFRWDRQVWKHDDTLKVYDLCRSTCRTYAVNAPPNVQKIIISGKTIAAVEKLIRTDRRHAATVDQWDSDPWLLNTPAGIVDLRTGDPMPHNPINHMTKRTLVSPGGACPLWMEFLDRVTNGDVLLQAYLKRVCGYALTGITREHAMFFAYGTGRNGKGVFLNTIVNIMGDYAMTADPDTFTASGAGKHLTVLARLQGARLVVAQETEEGIPWAEARIKSITGGDPITANYMRQDHFTYIPQFKLFMAGNHKPGLKAVDEAIKARFNLIPFDVTIPVDERDPELTEKLAAEGPGILAWMIEGCLDWQNVRLKPPPVVSDATGAYFEAEDAIATWIGECCTTGSEWHTAPSSALYKSWKAWSTAAGEAPMSHKRFSQALESRRFVQKKSHGTMAFTGIAIKQNVPWNETGGDQK